MAYATQSELEARLGRTLSASRASALLEDAASKIDGYVGGSLLLATGVVDRVRGYGSKYLFLPGPPTTALTAVQVDGDAAALASANYALRPATSSIERLDGDVWLKDRDVLVTRTRGWSAGSFPTRLVAINCALAARLLDAPAGVTRRRLGDFEEQFAASVEDPGRLADLLEAEKDDLDLWSFRAGEVHG